MISEIDLSYVGLIVIVVTFLVVLLLQVLIFDDRAKHFGHSLNTLSVLFYEIYFVISFSVLLLGTVVDLNLHLGLLILVALPSVADHYLWVAFVDIQGLLLVADPGSYAN